MNETPNPNCVIISMPPGYFQYLIVRVGDEMQTERIMLNREQAMRLLEILPEWIAKIPVSLNGN